MTKVHALGNSECPRVEIAAYLDGDLDPRAELEIEAHLAVCPNCVAELNEQKRILSALDLALEDDDLVEIPANFTKVVVANAESSVKGLRSPHERSRALLVCMGLFLLALIGLGAESSRTFGAVGAISDQTFAVGSFFAHLVHNVSVSTAFILRSFCLQFVLNSTVSMAVVIFLFGISLLIFARLVLKARKA